MCNFSYINIFSNYRGELYTKYRTRQINLTQHWIKTFMSDDKKYSSASEQAQNILQQAQKNTNQLKEKLFKSLTNYKIKNVDNILIDKSIKNDKTEKTKKLSRPKIN